MQHNYQSETNGVRNYHDAMATNMTFAYSENTLDGLYLME